MKFTKVQIEMRIFNLSFMLVFLLLTASNSSGNSEI